MLTADRCRSTSDKQRSECAVTPLCLAGYIHCFKTLAENAGEAVACKGLANCCHPSPKGATFTNIALWRQDPGRVVGPAGRCGVEPSQVPRQLRQDSRKQNQRMRDDGIKRCSDLAPARLKE